jgi:hypothetical protein
MICRLIKSIKNRNCYVNKTPTKIYNIELKTITTFLLCPIFLKKTSSYLRRVGIRYFSDKLKNIFLN